MATIMLSYQPRKAGGRLSLQWQQKVLSKRKNLILDAEDSRTELFQMDANMTTNIEPEDLALV